MAKTLGTYHQGSAYFFVIEEVMEKLKLNSTEGKFFYDFVKEYFETFDEGICPVLVHVQTVIRLMAEETQYDTSTVKRTRQSILWKSQNYFQRVTVPYFMSKNEISLKDAMI